MPVTSKSSGALEVSGIRSFGWLTRLPIPEVWIRFLLAILGLGLAFAAALFSTVTRESGSFWATLILASAALLLAVLVGLTTVPYLARRVAVARIRNAFDYDVTRAGIVYVATVVVIGIAALNTGNNLLYIIVAAMLGAILCSGVASALVLRGLQLDVRVPEHVFAGRPAAARIVLRNQRRWLPSFSISVVSPRQSKEAKKWRSQATTFSFPSGRPPEKQWFHIPDRQLRLVTAGPTLPEIFRGSAYFPYLPPRRELTADVKLCFQQRGRYQQESFGLSTRFPFAFLVKTRRIPLMREIIVYPSVEPSAEFFQVLPLVHGEMESWQRGHGSSLYRIREYTQEDSARHVDWKATAKSGSLKVREFTREDQRQLRIIFDNPQPETVSGKDYESAVALAASLSWHFAERNADVSFASQEYTSNEIHQFLACLAEIQPKQSPSCLEDLLLSDAYNVVITSRAWGSVPASLRACSHFVHIGGRAH